MLSCVLYHVRMIELVKLGNGWLAIYRTSAPAVLIVSPDEARSLELALGEVSSGRKIKVL